MALEKVLVVDDDPNICDVLMMYLENEGYSVILSYDGEEALVKFNALKPDIVLLDVMLPSMDGWQVCREIRKKSSVPIIMITAKGDTFDKVLATSLNLKKKNNERPCEKISPLSSAFPAFNLYGNSGNAIGNSHHCDSQHCLV